MPTHRTRSAFETLKWVFDETQLVCDECGYFDEDGEWEAMTDGSSVRYEHSCPSCGTKTVREIKRE